MRRSSCRGVERAQATWRSQKTGGCYEPIKCMSERERGRPRGGWEGWRDGGMEGESRGVKERVGRADGEVGRRQQNHVAERGHAGGREWLGLATGFVMTFRV
jgi:hypothetical protein